MKKIDNKGFSVLHALVILLVVGAVAGTGWYVWSRNNDSHNNKYELDTPNEVKKTEKISDIEKESEFEIVTHSQLGYSVKVPEGWTYKEIEHNNEFDNYNYLEFYSQNYLDEPDEAYQDIEKGLLIRIIASKVTQYNDYDAEKTYANAATSEAIFENKARMLSVDGVKVVQTIFAYEGPPVYEVKFRKGQTNYAIGLRKPFEDYKDLYVEFEPFLTEFNSIVGSFRFTEN